MHNEKEAIVNNTIWLFFLLQLFQLTKKITLLTVLDESKSH